MANNFTYKARVGDNGKLEKVYSKRAFDSDLKLFSGMDIEISFKRWRKSRTLKQNALFHAYVHEISDQTKMSAERVKRAIKAQFLTVDILDYDGVPMTNPATGEVLKEVRDTSDLNTEEMSELCENVKIWVMDFGVYLKAPNEQEELKFKDLE